jgi:hypothetical protein
MTTARHRPPRVLLFLVVLATVLAVVGTWRSVEQRPASAGVVAPPPPTRVCVTPKGFCPVGVVRTGDPCSCPDLLDGYVPGHVEFTEGPPVRPDARDWPMRNPADPLEGLGPLVGP